jgi:DNA-directed RNA polymerase specialized sigma24 family protein
MTDDELNKAFLALVEGGELDRILRQLRNKWDRTPREVVLNAVRDAAAEVVQRAKSGQAITNVAGLVRTIADRQLIKLWRAAQDVKDANGALELQANYPEVWQHDERRITQIKTAAAYVRTLIPKVDSESYRDTLTAMLDAAEQGRQLQPKDLGDQMGCSPNTASKRMERAPQRLLPILQEAGFDSLNALLNLPSPQDDETDNEEHNDD